MLVWQAPTRVMNPSVPQHIIDDAMQADPASAAARRPAPAFLWRSVAPAHRRGALSPLGPASPPARGVVNGVETHLGRPR